MPRLFNYLVYRYGSNADNQPMTNKMPVKIVRAKCRGVVQLWAREIYNKAHAA